jgi:tetratricopeptide (TPR) repeat protein
MDVEINVKLGSQSSLLRTKWSWFVSIRRQYCLPVAVWLGLSFSTVMQPVHAADSPVNGASTLANIALDDSAGNYALANMQLTSAIRATKSASRRKVLRHLLGQSCQLWARALIETGDNARAIVEAEAALSLARKTGDLALESRCLGDIADAQLETGHVTVASRLMLGSSALATKSRDMTAQQFALTNESRLEAIEGNYASAAELAESALKLQSKSPDIIEHIETLDVLSRIFARLGDLNEARGTVQTALALADGAHIARLQSVALATSGYISLYTGDYAGALVDENQAYKMAVAGGFQPLAAMILMYAGAAYDQTSRSTVALTLLQQALKSAGEQDDQILQLDIYDGIGRVESHERNFDEAARDFQRSLSVGAVFHNPHAMLEIQSELGYAYLNDHRISAGLACFQSGLIAARHNGDLPIEANDLSGIGRASFMTKNYRYAALCYQQSLTIANALHNEHGVAVDECNLAEALQYLHEYAAAENYYQQSLTLATKIDSGKIVELDLENLIGLSSYLHQTALLSQYQKQMLTVKA